MKHKEYLDLLYKEQDEVYAEFMRPLFPGLSLPIIGVRLPILRQLAKDLVQQDDWRTIVKEMERSTYEEEVLEGLLIGYGDCDWEEKQEWIKEYVYRIDNWGACDAFVATLKQTSRHLQSMWTLIEQLSKRSEVYAQRFSATMLIWYYMSDEWRDRALSLLCAMPAVRYYAQMAVAWALCEYFILSPDIVFSLLQSRDISSEIKKMTYKKIGESLRTPKEWRERIARHKWEPDKIR